MSINEYGKQLPPSLTIDNLLLRKMTLLVEMSSSWIWTRMVLSLTLDSFNGTKGQQVCLFKKELTTLVKNSFTYNKAKDSASLEISWWLGQRTALSLNYNLLFSRKVNEQLQVVNIMSWGMSKQDSGQVATSKDGGFRKMKSWGILISKFRLTAPKEAMIFHDIPWYSMIFHDIPWYPLQLRHSENKSWMKAWTSDRHKLCGKSHQCFIASCVFFHHFDERAKFFPES